MTAAHIALVGYIMLSIFKQTWLTCYCW